MVKVKLYDSYASSNVNTWEDGEMRDYVARPQHYFEWEMLCPTGEEEEKIPFRDAESIRLLRETYGIEFVSETDWYSVRCEGTRMNIWCLNKWLKAALAAIYNSRQGVYTWFEEYTEESVWKVLADLPFDILIAMRISEMGCHHDYIKDIDYKIVNYPYQGKTIEVTVLNGNIRRFNEFEKVPEADEHGTSYDLCVSSDGRYFMHGMMISYAFQYYWRNDIEGVIKCIDRIKRDKIDLVDTSRTFTVAEFDKVFDCYLEDVQGDWELYDAGDIEGYHKSIEENPEYIYFRDVLKITTHMKSTPRSATFRKLPMLMVDKNYDGTYFIYGELTVKYPAFHELVDDAIRRHSPDKETFILVVDREEVLESEWDLKDSLCGIKVKEGSVDIYDCEDAVELFGEALKEAHNSGRYTVSKEFS